MQNPEKILKLGVDNWGAQVLLCAVELGLFTELAEGPMTVEEIIECFDLNSRGVKDFLDSLVALGIIDRDEDEYFNTSDTDYFLDKKKPTYIGSVLSLQQYDLWGNLMKLLKTGKAQNTFSDRNHFYNELYNTNQKTKEYAESMTAINLGASIAISEKFPWDKYGNVVDIGAAQGGLLVQIAQQHTKIKCLGVDLPQVKDIFEEYAAKYGLEDRVKFQTCNFYTDELPAADVYTLGHILHAMDEKDRLALLKKIYNALPDGGALIVYEHIIDDERKHNAFALLMSLNMLLEAHGEGGLTGKQCCELIVSVGFKEVYVESLIGPSFMIVGFK